VMFACGESVGWRGAEAGVGEWSGRADMRSLGARVVGPVASSS
jgi:hypothetical protein